MKLHKRLLHIFSVQGMVREQCILSDLPETKRVYGDFLKIAWPSTLEAILVSLVGIINTIMVSSLGEKAIVAVGITNQPKYILLAIIMSLNVGVTAIIARRKGQNDRDGANHTLRVSILISITISALMAFLGFVFASPILKLAGAEASYMQYAVDYFRILMISIFFTSLSLTINAAQRGSGNTKISMQTNIAANIINIIFNYLLINGIGFFPRLEVKGAAIAATLGSIVACLMSIIKLLNKDGFVSLRYKSSWKISKTIFNPIIKVSSSALAEQVFMRIGFLIFAAFIARLGTTNYATHLICLNILNISFSFGDGIAIAATSLVGQNLGKSRSDLAIIYGNVGQRIAFVISIMISIFFIIFRFDLMALFSNDPRVITLGSHILIIIAITTYAQTSQVVMSGCLRGAGDAVFVASASLISTAIIRPILTYVLCFSVGLGLYGAWIALLLDQGFRCIANFKRFSGGKWSNIIL